MVISGWIFKRVAIKSFFFGKSLVPVASEAALYKHMAQKSLACILIVRAQLKIFQKATHRAYYLVRFFVLCHTGCNGDYLVRRRLIYARNYIAVPVKSESRLNLIAIVIRIFHSYNLADAAKFSEQPYALYLLISQLLLIC